MERHLGLPSLWQAYGTCPLFEKKASKKKHSRMLSIIEARDMHIEYPTRIKKTDRQSKKSIAKNHP
jgi:hypothetical protein